MDMNGAQHGAFPFVFPGIPGIRCVFTTRETGNLSLYRATLGDEDREKTLAARRGLFAALGVAHWTEVQQVHGDVFLKNPAPTPCEAEPVMEADGQATDAPNHALWVKTADCQPILLAHPKGCIAALHVGWRGNALGFPESAVAAFCTAYGLDPGDVRAVRGPSLGYAEFINFSREWPAAFAPWYDRESRRMDLWALTRDQLCRAGLRPGNIYGIDLCTYSLNAMFFSHRRGDTGRQAGVIWRE